MIARHGDALGDERVPIAVELLARLVRVVCEGEHRRRQLWIVLAWLGIVLDVAHWSRDAWLFLPLACGVRVAEGEDASEEVFDCPHCDVMMLMCRCRRR